MSELKDFFAVDENVEEAISECEESTQGGGNYKDRSYLKLSEGEAGNKIRILPPMAGQKAPWQHVRIHFSLTGPTGKKFPIQCGVSSGSEKCPLCDESRLFREQGDKNKSWNAAAKDQFLYNVVDDKGNFSILTVDKKLQTELIKAFKFAMSEDGGSYRPWDLSSGCYIKIVKTKGHKADGQRFAPNIYAVHLLARKPLDKAIIDKAPTSMAELNKIYRTYTVEQMNGMLDGTYNPFDKGKPETAKQEPAAKHPEPEVDEDVEIENSIKANRKTLEDVI